MCTVSKQLVRAVIWTLALAPCACGRGGSDADDRTDSEPDDTDGEPELSDQVQWVLGSVLRDDLTPVQAATIRLGSLETASDTNGRFGLETLAGLDNRAIVVRADGYLAAERLVPANLAARIELGAVILRSASASESISGARGGRLVDAAAGVQIDVPAGAFKGTVDVSTARIPLGDPLREDTWLPAPLPAPAGGAVSGLFAVQIDAGGAQPIRPLAVRVQVQGPLPVAARVPVGRFALDAGGWVDLGQAMVGQDGWLEFETSHLSTFAAALPALPADDRAVAPDLSGLNRASSVFKQGDPRIDPRSGALQVGVPLPPLIRAGQRRSLALFHDSRTVQPKPAIPVVATDATSGEVLTALVSTGIQDVRLEVHVREDAEPESAPAAVVDIAPLPAPQEISEQAPEAAAALEEVASGTVDAEVVLERAVPGHLAESTSGSFVEPIAGEKLSTAENQPVPAPAPVRLGRNLPISVAVDNRTESPFGAGWHLTGLTRLIQPFCSRTRATLVGGTDQPAIAYGELGELISHSIVDQLVGAGIERAQTGDNHVALVGGTTYVSIRSRGEVYRLDPAGGPAVRVAGGGSQRANPGQGPGLDLDLGSIEAIAAGPRGDGLLIVTSSYISLLGTDGNLTRVVGTGAAASGDDIRIDQPALKSTFYENLAPGVAADPASDRFVFSKHGDGAFEVRAGILKRLRLRDSSPHYHNFGFSPTGELIYSNDMGSCIYRHVDGLTDPELFPRCREDLGSTVVDGPADTALAGKAIGIAHDGRGNLWFIDGYFGVLRRYAPEGELISLSAQPVLGVAAPPCAPGLLSETVLGHTGSLAILDADRMWFGGSSPEDLLEVAPASPGILSNLSAGDGSLLRPNPDGSWTRVLPSGELEQYDARGLLLSRGQPGTAALEYRYSGDWEKPQTLEICGLPLAPPPLDSIELAGEALWSFEYQAGLLRTIEDAAGRRVGRVASAGRDRFDLPSSVSVEFRYDAEGRVVDQRKPEAKGSADIWTFGFSGGRLASYRQPGRTEQIVESAEAAVGVDGADADASGVLEDVDARIPAARLPSRAGQQASVVLGTRGLKVTSPAGDQTELESDRFGRLLRARHPDGSLLRLGRDEAGRLTMVCNERTTECFQYRYRSVVVGESDDPYVSERLVERIDPGGRITQFDYDSDGSLVSRQDPNGGIVRFGYQTSGVARGLPSSVTDAEGRVTRVEHDSAGNPVRLTQKGSAAGANDTMVTVIERDSAGFVVRMIEPSGREIHTQVDPWGEVVERTVGDPAEAHTLKISRQGSAAWTGEGDNPHLSPIVQLIDGETRKWSIDYESGWRQTLLVSPAAGAQRSEYDLQGQLTVRRWDDGSSETMTYDPAGRLSVREYQGPAAGARLEFEYDELGRAISLTDPGLREERSFQPGLGWKQVQWLARGETAPEASFLLGRTRLGFGVTDQVIGSNRFVLHRGFDDRVERVEHAWTDNWQSLRDALRIERDRSGRLTRLVRANGTETTIEYDPLGRVLRQREQAASGSAELSWEWQADRPVRRTLNGSVRDLTFDEFGRLTGCSDTGETYTWNRADERASARGIAYVRDPAGRLTYDGIYDYTYDALGRRIARVARADPADRLAYSWGAGGRLSALRIGLPGSETELVAFAYDGSGRMVARTDAAGTTRLGYLPDSERPVRALTPDGTEWHLVHALPGAGYSAAVASDGRERYLHLDSFDRVLGVSDQHGALTLFDEECFGLRLADPGLNGLDFGFHGMLFDRASGLYVAGARVYDPRVGEFLSPDPRGLEAAPPIYSYAAGDPILAQDPGGRLLFVAAGAVLGGLFVLNEIRKFAQSEDVKRTKNSYQRMGDIADDDSALGDAERSHQNLANASKRGGLTALKSVKKAADAVTNPAGNAQDLAEQAGDLAESLLDEGCEGQAGGEPEEP